MRQTLTSYLSDFLARGDEIAFSHRRGLRIMRWSYKEIAEAAAAFAELLEQRGIKRGDRVLLLGENSPEWVAAFFACVCCRAIVVPLDVQSEPAFVKRVQQHVGARLAVADRGARERFPSDLPLIPLEQITRRSNGFTGTPATGAINSLLQSAPESSESSESADDTVEVMFTSGTTAEPKGVVITHKNILANLQPLEEEIQRYRKWERFVHPIRFLNLVPLSHVFGQLMGMFVPQLLAGEVFFIDSFKPAEIIETVKRERISVIVCVPRMLETLKENIELSSRDGKVVLGDSGHRGEELSVVRRWWKFRHVHQMLGWKFWAFVCGGATLDRETEQFWQRLGFAVIQGYGMTETAALVAVNHPFKKRSGSIGAAIPGQELKLSENGEILLRGPNVSPGYWEEQGPGKRGYGETGGGGDRETGGGGDAIVAEDLWFHTGDIAEVDQEGNLFFKGRQKEVIITSAGMNIYPPDLEAVLDRQPEIKMCAVVGVNGSHGPEPVATLILRNQFASDSVTANIDAEAQARLAIERANQSLADFQKIRRWFIWPDADFPRTPTQKVKRHLITEKINSAARAHTAPAKEISGELARLIAQVSGETVPQLQSAKNLGNDLNLDSLGRVELLSAIEDHYSIEIDEATFSEATTVADIQRIIGLESDNKSPTVKSQKSAITEYAYPNWPHRWPINWLRIMALHLIIFPFVRVLGRARITGLENLTGQNNPLLFISNHLTMVDHALILWALPRRFRTRMAIAMDGELLRQWLHPAPGTGLFERLRYRCQYVLVAFFFNVFSMPQHTGFRLSFKFAGKMMDRGYSVLVFPEGRRSPDGKLQPLRLGIGILANQLNAQVVPLRIDGLYEVARQKRRFGPKGAIKVSIGKPVSYSRQASAEDITKDLSRRLASNL
jgi:long-chain acyl-CoA synthetase